jgi:hypothetical protein
MSSTPEPRRSFLGDLLRRGRRKNGDASDEADQQLDAALERLTQSLNEHEVVSAQVKRRQSSGALKIASVPVPEDVR